MLQSKPLSISLKAIVGAAVLCFFLLVIGHGTASAERIGVGVGTGRIVLDQPIKPGLTYTLPPVAVFNNGDVASDYEMTVQFNEKQPEMKPSENWVEFTPKSFKLEPGKSTQVTMTLKTASSARPGDYFAYLEAHPLKKDTSGQTAINVAAATKFSFKVANANFWQKILYWLQDFWNKHKSIIIAVGAVMTAIVLILLGRKYLRIELRRKK